MKRGFGKGYSNKGGKGREGGENGVRISRGKGKQKIRGVFWNVAGVRKKEEDFWEFLTEFEVVGLTETWIDEVGWGKLKGRMPEGWRWKSQPAKRDSKKGRAKGGIITGVRKEIEERERGRKR